MSRTVKCPATGCPGVVTIETDGNGGTRDRCPCCERRAAWKAKNLPNTLRYICEICGGQWMRRRGGGRSKYCYACRRLMEQKVRYDAHVQRQQREPAPARPLRTA